MQRMTDGEWQKVKATDDDADDDALLITRSDMQGGLGTLSDDGVEPSSTTTRTQENFPSEPDFQGCTAVPVLSFPCVLLTNESNRVDAAAHL